MAKITDIIDSVITKVNEHTSKLSGIEDNATADQTKADIDALGIDASTVNGKTVQTSVPAGAVFTDTIYSHPSSHPATMITTTDEFAYSNSTNVQDVLDDLDQAIANVNAKDPVITLTGDVTGSGTMTNLGNVSITATVADDSHNHTIANVDGLQTALDNKLSTSGKAADSDKLDGLHADKFNRTLAYYNTSGSVGRVMIKLPFLTNSSKMLSFDIDLYSNYVRTKIFISGYLYGSPNNWYTPRATIESTGGTLTVTMGRTSDGYAYVSIPVGSYAGVKVSNLTLGYSGSVSDYLLDGWQIIDTDDVPNTVSVAHNTIYHSGNIPTWNQSTTGNAATASKLAAARNIALSGDVTGSVDFDGSANVSITTAVGNNSHTHNGTTIDDNSISAAELNVSGNGTTSQYLRADGDGSFTWATPPNTIYTHPTYAGDDISIDTNPLTGATVISDLDFNVTTDTQGHVTDANATIATRNLTAGDIGAAAASHTHSYLPLAGGTLTGDLTVSGGDIVLGGTGRIQGVDTVSGDTDAASKLYVDSEITNRSYGFKNYIINGGFNVWQRGTSLTSQVGGSFLADRWHITKSAGNPTWSVSRSRTSTTGGSLGKIEVTNAPDTIYMTYRQKIEDVRILSGKTMTISFVCQAPSDYKWDVRCLQHFGSGGSSEVVFKDSHDTLVNVTSGLGLKTLTFDVPSVDGKTINDANSFTQIEIRFSNTTNQIGNIYLGEVQLEEGSVATQFEQRPYGLELSLCQRYYETGEIRFIGNGYTSTAYLGGFNTFRQVKRVSPSIAINSVTENINLGSPTINGSADGFRWFAAVVSAGNAYYSARYSSDAEL